MPKRGYRPVLADRPWR